MKHFSLIWIFMCVCKYQLLSLYTVICMYVFRADHIGIEQPISEIVPEEVFLPFSWFLLYFTGPLYIKLTQARINWKEENSFEKMSWKDSAADLFIIYGIMVEVTLLNGWFTATVCGPQLYENVGSVSCYGQISKKHYFMTSGSSPASRLWSCLSSYTDFFHWWTVIVKHKSNKSLPHLAFCYSLSLQQQKP